MPTQSYFSKFHKTIKVETEELREKRDILVEKIRASLKEAGHPLPEVLNQGSYIYGVGVKPLGDEEYDIDVGLDFDILSTEFQSKTVRGWVYDAIEGHTKNVEDRGPCIRVRYAAGYHVDLVIYARHKDNKGQDAYQLGFKNGDWKDSSPKDLKTFIQVAREPFKESKDSSGSDQLQRITRMLKRWNDEAIKGESDDKPSGLATLLLVIELLKVPKSTGEGTSDIDAMLAVADGVSLMGTRIIIKKPTPGYEDLYAKISDDGMKKLKSRFADLAKDLRKAKGASDEEGAKLLAAHFGSDFPTTMKRSDTEPDTNARVAAEVADMKAAIPAFKNPSRPHAK